MPIRRMIRHNLAYLAFLAVLIVCSAFFTWRVEVFRARATEDRGLSGAPRAEESPGALPGAVIELPDAEPRP